MTETWPTHFPEAWMDAWGEDDFGPWTALKLGEARQVFRWIPPGSFMMGSPEEEREREENEVQHSVTLSKGFWMADTSCPQALWEAVMGENPSYFEGKERPVETVSWEDAQVFFKRLKTLKPNYPLRLPTEAEWEYACRAGTKGSFAFGDILTTDLANYDGNYPYHDGEKGEFRGGTLPVTALYRNAWGLYQMHGNVWEWCQDWYSVCGADAGSDPVGPGEGTSRVLRGGSWDFDGAYLRSACRDLCTPDFRSKNLGFRFVLDPLHR